MLRSPGPCSPPIFRSAICDCLSLNVSFSLHNLIGEVRRAAVHPAAATAAPLSRPLKQTAR
jgi:hypothetical protein